MCSSPTPILSYVCFDPLRPVPHLLDGPRRLAERLYTFARNVLGLTRETVVVPAPIRGVLNVVRVTVSVGKLVNQRPKRRNAAPVERFPGQHDFVRRLLVVVADRPTLRCEMAVNLPTTGAAHHQHHVRNALVVLFHGGDCRL